MPASLSEEFQLLQAAVVDGVITTNFDRMMERVFTEFRPYIGQDELLFSDTQGIAEIYYIHGCEKRPESLVLTAEDYEDYTSRNAYLAAKLATIFVEHPVIFLGYSLADRNIRQLLESLVIGLRAENVAKLQDRLIFIEYEPHTPASISTSIMNIDGISLPIIRATVPDFADVFRALGERQRRLPARVLRVLKEQVYELVQTNDPSGRLMSVTDISGKDASRIDVVFGVGAKINMVGVVGLTRWDIVNDVLNDPDRGLPAEIMVSKALPKIAFTTYVPIFKYLVNAGLWADGSWVSGVTVDEAVRRRADSYAARFSRASAGGTLPDIATLENSRGWEGILNAALDLPSLTQDAEGLRDLLVKEKSRRENQWWATQTAKAAVAYDWLRYGAVR